MNHKIILGILLVITFSLGSCTKNGPSDVNFTVSTNAKTYSVSDIVTFSMSGNPDIIAFYSGDSANNYDYRDRTSKTGGTINFSFQIRASNDSVLSAIVNGAFKVLVSNNFPGTYSTLPDSLSAKAEDSAMLNSTIWTDVTKRFTIPTTTANWAVNTYYITPTVDISDLILNAENPLNIAFKFAADTTHYFGTNGLSLGSFVLKSVFPDGTGTSFNVVPGGSKSTTWTTSKTANPLFSWATSSTQIKFIPKYGTNYTEDWAISNGFYPNVAQPDLAIPIKNITQSPLTTFSYQFKQPGFHKVVFIASNNRVSGQNQVVREIDLNITP